MRCRSTHVTTCVTGLNTVVMAEADCCNIVCQVLCQVFPNEAIHYMLAEGGPGLAG